MQNPFSNNQVSVSPINVTSLEFYGECLYPNILVCICYKSSTAYKEVWIPQFFLSFFFPLAILLNCSCLMHTPCTPCKLFNCFYSMPHLRKGVLPCTMTRSKRCTSCKNLWVNFSPCNYFACSSGRDLPGGSGKRM